MSVVECYSGCLSWDKRQENTSSGFTEYLFIKPPGSNCIIYQCPQAHVNGNLSMSVLGLLSVIDHLYICKFMSSKIVLIHSA